MGQTPLSHPPVMVVGDRDSVNPQSSAAISAASSGDNTVVSAASGKSIYVTAFTLSFSGTVNAKFTDGAGGADLTGLYYGVANAGAGGSIAHPCALFWTTPGNALVLNLSGATAVGGHVTYYTA